MSCNDDTKGSYCNGKDCTTGSPSDCFSNMCVNEKCGDLNDALDGAGEAMAAGIIVLIIIVVCICCCIVGCIVCCVMGVGFCAKKGAEAAAA